MFFGLVQMLQGFFLVGHLAGGNSFPKPISAEDEKKYFQKYSEGSEDAKNVLIEHNLRLVAYVARKYSNHPKESEDIISVGTIGLIKAISTYSFDKGTRLATYAIRCIDNAMYFRVTRRWHTMSRVICGLVWGITPFRFIRKRRGGFASFEKDVNNVAFHNHAFKNAVEKL